ncbi:351_t:CDS:2 [Funneliformis geosporum]|nr:351_t:CDS:2 [Funneliformis geosporum]
MQDDIVKKLADYNIYDTLQNSAEIWSMVLLQTISNCWKKIEILPPNNKDENVFEDDFIFDENIFNENDEELERLIFLLLKGDLNAQEYIYIEDKVAEGRLTDDKIIDAILNVNRKEEHVIDEIEFVLVLEKVSPVEAENAIDKIIRFLYKQEVEFGKINLIY